MRQISLTRFRRVVQEENIQAIHFHSLRQTSCVLSDVVVDGEFEKISVMFNPNRILLSSPVGGGCNRLCFSRVKGIVDYDTGNETSVMEYGIVCGSSTEDTHDELYRISLVKNM